MSKRPSRTTAAATEPASRGATDPDIYTIAASHRRQRPSSEAASSGGGGGGSRHLASSFLLILLLFLGLLSTAAAAAAAASKAASRQMATSLPLSSSGTIGYTRGWSVVGSNRIGACVRDRESRRPPSNPNQSIHHTGDNNPTNNGNSGGKMIGLEWADLRCTTQGPEREILKGVSGRARPGR